MSISDRVLKNVFSNWVGMIVRTVLGFIQAPIVITGLGSVWYRIWILVHQTTGCAWLFDFGIREAVVRYVSKHHSRKEFDTINGIVSSAIYLLISVLTMVIISALIVSLPHLFDLDPNAVIVARIVLFLTGLTLAINWFFNTYVSILMGLQRFDIFQKVGILMGLVNFALVIIFIKTGYAIITLSLIGLCVSIISNAIIYKKTLLNTTQLAGWMKTGSPKANKHGISWAWAQVDTHGQSPWHFSKQLKLRLA